ncbi:MAG TPA: response regulator [Bryobacteraceae bacterium]|nr:response regulator [Bryobacteraceae bacterium]
MWHFLGALMAHGKSAYPATIGVVTQRDQDRRLLREVCQREGFDLLWAGSCEEAISAWVRRRPVMILCDRDIPDLEWRGAIRKLSAAFPVCVILTSPVVDDYLSIEVARCGGFDVLPTPLRDEHVVRAIKLASSYSNSLSARTLGS